MVSEPILEIDSDRGETQADDGDCLESIVQRAKKRKGAVLHLRDEAAEQVRRYEAELAGLTRMIASVDEGTGVDPTAMGSPEPLVSASPRPMRQPKPDDPLAEAKTSLGWWST